MINTALMIFAVTLAQVEESNPRFDDNGYPTKVAEEEVGNVLRSGIAEWMNCSKSKIRILYKSNDSAPVVAAAAMTKCKNYEQPLPELYATLIAINISRKNGFDFKSQYKYAQIERDNHWNKIRKDFTDQLSAEIVTLRSSPH